jgi:hypothetical protein
MKRCTIEDFPLEHAEYCADELVGLGVPLATAIEAETIVVEMPAAGEVWHFTEAEYRAYILGATEAARREGA